MHNLFCLYQLNLAIYKKIVIIAFTLISVSILYSLLLTYSIFLIYNNKFFSNYMPFDDELIINFGRLYVTVPFRLYE
jgi:hypothetical protein